MHLLLEEDEWRKIYKNELHGLYERIENGRNVGTEINIKRLLRAEHIRLKVKGNEDDQNYDGWMEFNKML